MTGNDPTTFNMYIQYTFNISDKSRMPTTLANYFLFDNVILMDLIVYLILVNTGLYPSKEINFILIL